MVLVCHVILHVIFYVIKALNNFSLSKYVTILPSLVAIDTLVVEI